jgi:hypothetical protein
MFRNSITGKLRSKAGSFLVASSIAVATIAVAGLTESPVSAAPVSFGQIMADRTVASNGSFNVYSGEEVIITAGAQINFSSSCLGEVVLQPGDVITMTEPNFGFTGDSYFSYGSGSSQGNSFTLPNPIPANYYLSISAGQLRRNITSTGTMTVAPKLKVTRGADVVVENETCVYFYPSASIDANIAGNRDVSEYVARSGDSRLSYNATACVDMTLVGPGDVLTYGYSLKTGGQDVDPQGGTPNYNWSESMLGVYPGNTIRDPEPTRLELMIGGASGPGVIAGNTYTFSLDIKKGNDSVAINCPVNNPNPNPGNGGGSVPLPDGGGGPITMPRLYPTGQVSLTGELTLGSTVSVSLPSWSLTDGGPALASTDILATQFTWLLCSVGPVAQRTSNTSPPSACQMSGPPSLLAGGSTFGNPTGAGQLYSGSSLTITEPLLTALTGKHLMVSVFIESAPAPGQMMGIFFNFNFKSCAPGENCADSFGPTSTTTTTVPATTTTTVQATTTTVQATTTTTPATTAPSSSSPNAPSQATTTIPVTTTVPATTTTVPATTTTVPPPALATVQALPVAPTPIVADATISRGEEITVSFGGFTPFEFVQLIVASTPQVIGSGYANAQGVVTLSGNLPSTLASGNHTLAVFAPVSGIGFTQPITVSQPLLPATGSDGQNNLYVIAMLLFVLGIVVRRTSTVITNK